jgi:hypothetical protein
MEKILPALDVQNPDNGALDFACYPGALTNSKITGIFLSNLTTADRMVARELSSQNDANRGADTAGEGYMTERKTIYDNISLFRETCE